ncbi:cupin domain-containing protein [Falsiroseomonas sp. HC035]|uniref:cupin domain-containing protein n=1 Tax=Falsiroseomonas sp. HC035 TaxID=3390999 RepID=UPI003D31578C
MEFPLRRVVTGHDAQGRAVVQIDDIPSNLVSKRPGHNSFVVWTTVGNPVDNTGTGDDATRPVGTELRNGSVFRIMKLDPGVAPRPHRTASIDYLIVLSGAVTMELDEGSVDLRAGDLLVQRGTFHNWIVTGTEPCLMAVVLIDAKPVEVGETTLGAFG